jgi:ribosomal protein L24E
VFTVSADLDGRLVVHQDNRIMYKLSAKTWRQQLMQFRQDGWEIIWAH